MSAIGSITKTATSVLTNPATSSLLRLAGTYSKVRSINKKYSELARTDVYNAQMYSLGAQDIAQEGYDTLNNLTTQYLETQALLGRKQRQTVGSNTTYYGSRGVEIAGSAIMNIMDNINQFNAMKSRAFADYSNKYTAVSRQYGYAENKYKYSASESLRRAKHTSSARRNDLLGLTADTLGSLL